MSWNPLYVGPEGQPVTIGGVSVWSRPWKTQGEVPIQVQHPYYPNQKFELKRYFIESGGTTHEFAATKTASGLWLLYEQQRTDEYLAFLTWGAYIFGTAGAFILVHGFTKSPILAFLGAALLAASIGAELYAKSRRSAA